MTETREDFKTGLKFFKEKKFEKALNIFQKEIQENPSNIFAYFLIGKIYFYKKKYDLALKFIEISYNQVKNRETISYYGKVLIFNGDFHKAISILETNSNFYSKNSSEDNLNDKHNFKSHNDSSKENLNENLNEEKFLNEENMFYLSIAYYNINNIDKAFYYINRCEKRFINHPLFKQIYTLILYKYGSNLLVNERIDDAIRIYEKLVLFNKNFYKGFFQLGLTLIEKKNYKKAISIFEKLKKNYDAEIINIILIYLYDRTNEKEKLEVLIKDSKIANGILSNDDFEKILAYTLIRNKKYGEAIPILIKLHKRSVYDENILYFLAIAREMTNDLERALNCYKKIFSITEKNVSINNSYILFLLKNYKYEEGFYFAKKSIEGKNFDNKTLLYYFYSAVFAGININFEEYIEKLQNEFGENAIFLEATGKYYKDIKNDYVKATSYFYKLYNMENNDNWTLIELCDIFSKKDMKNHALFYLKKLYEKEKSNQEIVYLYGKILLHYGEVEEALNVLNNFDKKDYRINFLLSKISLIKSLKKDATAYLKKSLDENPLYFESLYLLLKFYYKNKQYEKALNIAILIEKTVKEKKQGILIQIIKSLIYYKLLNFEESLNTLIRLHKREKYSSYLVVNSIKILLFYNHKYEKLKSIILNQKQKIDNHINTILLLLINKKEYNLEKIKTLENDLFTRYKNFKISKDYMERYIKLKSKPEKRKDLGLRIIM